MALKPRYKRRILWTAISFLAALLLAVIFVPPMITLNSLKPRIENAIYTQTGLAAQINGNIHFSLIGHTTIVAHDISTPIGQISSAMFVVPLASVFDMSRAQFADKIGIYGANLGLERLNPTVFGHDIEITNSVIRFKEKDYEIISGQISNGQFRGIVRTNQHKYYIDFMDDEFHVTNKNNDLDIVGQIYSNGTARGTISLDTANVNKWFEFSTPQIPGSVKMTMDFEWDGDWDVKFTNIRGENFSGAVEILGDGRRNITMNAHDVEFDFSFLLDAARLLYDTTLNLDMRGDLTIDGQKFNHLKFNAVGTKSGIQIANIVVDDFTATGGTIDRDGAHDVMITTPIDDVVATCMLNTNAAGYSCREFSYGDITGTINVTNNEFDIVMKSDKPMPDIADIRKRISRFGTRGRITFNFSDAAGVMTADKNTIRTKYTFAKNKTVRMMMGEIKFLPKFMMDAPGNIKWDGTRAEFTPNRGAWRLIVDGDRFEIFGENVRDLFPEIDLQSIRDMEYSASGTFRDTTISKLKINIASHEFTGAANGNAITLRTDVLNIDSFISQKFIDNYDELEFLTNAPILIPFSLPVDVALSANTLIYNGDEFNNFIYTLKSGVQTFSISDTSRGNILATIKRAHGKYDIFAQLNKFAINGTLLSAQMPLNIRDTLITGEINLSTYGQIAHDISYNLAGDVDLTFNGGYIIGIGTDGFYAASNNISTMNAEYALSAALESGQSRLKTMRVIGKYSNGDFVTTRPMTFDMRHINAMGNLNISGACMTAAFDITMRGTSPKPMPITLRVMENGNRQYSLSQIMINFDAGYLRKFVATHDKF